MLGPGSRVGPYRVLTDPLSTGGMSEVFLADRRRRSGRTFVALKVLDEELAAREEVRARIEGATPILRDLGHPGPLGVLDVGEHEGTVWVAVPWLQAVDLRSAIRMTGPLRFEGVVWIVGGAAGALDALHESGLIYADMKPGNVLLSSGGRNLRLAREVTMRGYVHLAHSWLTWPSAGPFERFSREGEFAGSIDYTAPEVISGGPGDARSDVYGLGCTLYEALAGRIPFPYRDEDDVLDAHLSEPPPSLQDVPGLPPHVEKVLTRAMAKDPAERFPTAGAMATALLGNEGGAPTPQAPEQPPALPA